MSQRISFLKRFDLKVPVIQAPMAGISTVKLASIVTNKGGLGSIPFGATNLTGGHEAVANDIEEFKKLTNNSNNVNLNFFCHSYKDQPKPTVVEELNWIKLFNQVVPQSVSKESTSFKNANVSFKEIEEKYPQRLNDLLQFLDEYRPKVISFHFGCPSAETVKRLQRSNIAVFISATSVQEAEVLLELGVDGIVCQGYEAGGHRGNFLVSVELDENLSTAALFSQVMKLVNDSKSKPYIIPAGGIVNSETIKFYLSQGASAVQMGSVFLTTPESNSNGFIKNCIDKNEKITTIMTSLISGKPARTIKTKFIDLVISNYNTLEITDLPSYGYSYHAYKEFLKNQKNPNLGFYLAGQNYHLIDTNLTTGQVMEKLLDQLKNLAYEKY